MSWSWKAGIAGLALVSISTYAAAQMSGRSGMHGFMRGMQSGMHADGDEAMAMGETESTSSHMGRHMGGMMGMGMGMMGGRGGDAKLAGEVDVVFQLLRDHDGIRRTVTNLPDGIRTITESDEPRIAQLIKDHVATQRSRVNAGDDPGLPIESPALRRIYRDKDKIRTKVEMTEKGVVIVQTSDDRKTVATLQEHAAEVTNLVEGGMAALHTAMMRNHGMGMMQGMRGGMMPDRREAPGRQP
jgi:hypothetical protein